MFCLFSTGSIQINCLSSANKALFGGNLSNFPQTGENLVSLSTSRAAVSAWHPSCTCLVMAVWRHPEGRNDQFITLRVSFKHSQPNQSETKHDYHLDYHKRLEFLSIGIFIWNNRFDLKSEFFLLDSFIIIF